MITTRLLTSTAVLACGGLCACSWFGADNPETPPTNPNTPKLVGRIAAVPIDQHFVLIQCYGNWTASPGTVLTTRGPEGRTANLLATGEASGNYAAADVQAGTLAQGDAVYVLPSATEQDPEKTTEPPVQPSTAPSPPATTTPAKPSKPPENKDSVNF